MTDPETFIDITGTWEMVSAILKKFTPNRALFDSGIDWERHCLPGEYLCQSLMIAGGVIEWVGAQLNLSADFIQRGTVNDPEL